MREGVLSEVWCSESAMQVREGQLAKVMENESGRECSECGRGCGECGNEIGDE